MNGTITENSASATAIKETLQAYIKPLLPGAALSGPYTTSRGIGPVVSFDSRHRLRISITPKRSQYFVFERTVPFSEDERVFIEGIIQSVQAHVHGPEPAPAALVENVVMQAIAKAVAPDCTETVCNVIRMYEQWKTDACGARRPAHTTGIRSAKRKNTDADGFAFTGSELVRALGSSTDSLVVIDAKGTILAVEKTLPTAANCKSRQEILAPVMYADIAAWAGSWRKIAVRRTEDGAILLFSRRCLLFFKRNGLWHSFPHSLMDIRTLPESIDGVEAETVKAVYLTALDMTALKTNACIGLIRNPPQSDGAGRFSGLRQMSSGKASKNARLLASLLSTRTFAKIPRTIRAEVCALHGMLVLDGQGTILGVELLEKGQISRLAEIFKRDDVGMHFPGKGYMELFNRDGQIDLRLSIR